MCARDMDLARAAVGVAKTFGVAFMGLAGTCHQTAAEEQGVKFIAGRWLTHITVLWYLTTFFTEWFADLEYSPEGKLLITKCLSCCPEVSELNFLFSIGNMIP